MNKTSLAILIGSIVAAVAGGAALTVVYVRFTKTQEEISSSTIGDMLALRNKPKVAPEVEESVPVDVFEEKVVEALETLEKEEVITSEPAKKPAPKSKPKKNKEDKKDE